MVYPGRNSLAAHLLQHCRAHHPDGCPHRKDIFLRACNLHNVVVQDIVTGQSVEHDFHTALADEKRYSSTCCPSLLVRLIRLYLAWTLPDTNTPDANFLQDFADCLERVHHGALVHLILSCDLLQRFLFLQIFYPYLQNVDVRLHTESLFWSSNEALIAGTLHHVFTPLQRALYKADIQFVRLLLSMGSNPNDDSLHMLISLGPSPSESFRQEAMILLVAYGADVNRLGRQWPATPIDLAYSYKADLTAHEVAILLKAGLHHGLSPIGPRATQKSLIEAIQVDTRCWTCRRKFNKMYWRKQGPCLTGGRCPDVGAGPMASGSF